MKFNLFLLFAAAVVLLSSKCQTSPAANGGEISKANEALYQAWLNSYEEDADNKTIFRPESFAFPPSRGRTGFKLEKSGQGVAYQIAPTDGRQTVPLTWTLEENVLTLIPQNGENMVMRITSLKEDRMEVESID